VRWLVAAALLAGCLDDLAPEVGPPLAPRCLDEDSDPATAVPFSHVEEVLEEYCLGCHSPTAEHPLGIEIGGLDLSSYASLRAGGVRGGASIVVPGRPCESVIFLKVGPAPPFGSRMPFGFPPLDDEDLEVLHDWIAEGARAD